MIIYSWVSLVFGILFALIALLMLVSLFVNWLEPKIACFVFFIVCSLVSLRAIHTSFDRPDPEKDDVIKGDAVYQETQIIQNGDTIRLYDIVWKEK